MPQGWRGCSPLGPIWVMVWEKELVMLNWMKKVAMSVVAGGVLLIGQAAGAATVQFYTVGTFSGGSGSFVITNGAVGASVPHNQTSSLFVDAPVGGGGSTLTYDNSSKYEGSMLLYDVSSDPVSINLGFFKLSGAVASADSFNGFSFKLDIYQLQPTVNDTNSNSSSLVGSLSGSLSNTNSSTVKLHFNPSFVYVPDAATGVRYSIDVNSTTSNYALTAGPNGRTLDGFAAVPLPKTASMGLAMFGALGVVAGGAALRRRSIAIA